MTQATIDVGALREILERGDPVTVLDVRLESQRTDWRIPGCGHFDTYGTLKADDPNVMEGADLPDGQLVVTVCAVDNSSAVAAEQLRDRGFEAYTLEGGMKAWSIAWNAAEVPESAAEVVQVRRTGKGCLPYLVGSGREAAVIDAAVNPEIYLELAERRGWSISRVLETHVHADHLSRSQRLAELTGSAPQMPP